ncbi:TetR/AcrR family transcriptional regulator [Pseudoteredinibacter isoporae]|uniref:TetR/AcrR family transcriptional regulator n=1 Tax=Pseudoteredinibacter isoporae TaxID=570281 RepID=UPI00310AD87E
MPLERQEERKTKLAPRRQPIQERAKQKTQQILDATARLLDDVGFDDLTTILIAKDLGISVGALYHYFPNKHAILYALGERWLNRMTEALEATERLDIESMSLESFVSCQLDLMLDVYREQRAILPLAQALWAIPELRELDAQHDDVVIRHFMNMYKRQGFTQSDDELGRIARLQLETSHALLLSVVDQSEERSEKSLQDLKALCCHLLNRHQS